MEPSESAKRMSEMIKKAMEDGIITNAEYNKIMAIADEDGHLDNEERALLRHLHDMIADHSVKRVAE